MILPGKVLYDHFAVEIIQLIEDLIHPLLQAIECMETPQPGEEVTDAEPSQQLLRLRENPIDVTVSPAIAAERRAAHDVVRQREHHPAEVDWRRRQMATYGGDGAGHLLFSDGPEG